MRSLKKKPSGTQPAATEPPELASVASAASGALRIGDKGSEGLSLKEVSRLLAIADAVPIGLAQIDSSQRYLYANHRYSEWFGLSQDTIVGLSLVQVLGESAYQRAQSSIEAALQGRTISFENRLLSDRRDERWVYVTLVPYQEDSGPVKSLFAVVHDITERRQAEQAQRRLEAKLQQTQHLESLGVLAGGIAHDFNNLLAAILANASLALEELSPESLAGQSLLEIEQAARRAAELTRQMLAYSGKGKLVVEPVDLSQLILQMTQLIGASVSKKCSVSYRFASALPPVDGDPSQIRQLLMNLIANASEALGEASGEIEISTELRECDEAFLADCNPHEGLSPGPYLVLQVRDSGMGMSGQTLSRIFDPFFSTKFLGRGLGLAVVHGIARGHHGTVRVYSELGKGTSVLVLFPTFAPRPVRGREPTSDFSRSASSPTVLIIEDEQTVRQAARKILTRAGFSVLEAPDGRQGLAQYGQASERIDVVLLDLSMPEMDGTEVYKELRRAGGLHVPIILTSGYGPREVLGRLSDRGWAGFLQKPYEAQQLVTLVRRLVGQ